MPRRRARSKSPLPLLLVLAALVAAGWAAWRYGPALLARWRGAPTPVLATTDVCALLDTTAVRDALDVPAVAAFRRGAAADVPAAGACTWTFDRAAGADGSIVALLFTRESLAAGRSQPEPAGFYMSTVTGLEYALKLVPAPLDDLGDAAAVAGFGSDDPRRGQLVVRAGDSILHLVADGAGRGATEALARRLVARL
jgi:hypothetical protein